MVIIKPKCYLHKYTIVFELSALVDFLLFSNFYYRLVYLFTKLCSGGHLIYFIFMYSTCWAPLITIGFFNLLLTNIPTNCRLIIVACSKRWGITRINLKRIIVVRIFNAITVKKKINGT